ncbi:MAG TPA: hypothetical protein DDZ96_13145 [Porphyromonadaceae bacterium]|jgi:hypothetical protein|nr:hypothetical protein [Porphyromonadaceae bacterium]HBL34741.1 hypothetical protein [Porphyromonadaceae bacterium]HCM21629.1 hypothetical protein [Porphyromonadaceae bacterium]
MKKKLTRDSFSALRSKFVVLDEPQQKAIVGGDYWDDHGIWALDSSGNTYWTRTSQGDGYYYGDSGYSSGSYEPGYGYYGSGSYSSDSYNSYPGQGYGDCVIQSVAYMFGLSLEEVHSKMSEVLQELYGYSKEASDVMAGGTGAKFDQVEALMNKISNSCYVSSYNGSSSTCALGLIGPQGANPGHAIVLEYYNASANTYNYVDPQNGNAIGTILASDLLWVITAN